MAEDFVERTEPATPRRRAFAREQGQIVKSHDLAGAVMLLFIVVGLWVMMSHVMEHGRALVAESLSDFGDAAAATGTGASESIERALIAAMKLGGPIVLVAWIGVLCAQVVQTGLIFVPKNALPDLGRLNPVRSIKRIFSVSGAFRSAMDLAKLVVVTSIAAMFVSQHGREIVSLPFLSGSDAIERAGSLTLELLMWTTAALLVLGILDFGYQRWKAGRDLRMTRQDVNQELKQSESDRQNKRRRVQIQRALASRLKLEAIDGADAVICDDASGFVVALRHDRSGAGLPRVVAKGRGSAAIQIRRAAMEQGASIVHQASTARTLYERVRVDQEIPADLCRETARILGNVYARGSNEGDAGRTGAGEATA